MKNRVIAFIFIIGLIGFSSCQDQSANQRTTPTSSYSDYVQAHTDGYILSGDPVIIILKQSLTGYNSGDELPSDLFDFSPGIDGKVFLNDANKIEFYADDILENGKSYKVDFNLGSIISVPKGLEKFRFEFEVIPLDFSVLEGSLEGEGSGFSYKGKIQSSDAMEVEDLISSLSLSDADKDMDLIIEAVGAKVFEYKITGITKKEDRSVFQLEWNGKKIGLDQSGSIEISVPGKNEFVVVGVFTEPGEDQHIRLVFSDDLDERQNLDGLIYLEGEDNVGVHFTGQEVYLYPQSRLQGERTLIIEESVKSSSGIKLLERESYNLNLSPLPPEVEFLGKGYILPDANGLFLPFRAVSLRAVDIYVYRIYANNVQQFLQENQPQAQYSLRGSLKYVGRPVFKKTIRLDQDASLDLSQWNSFTIDLSNLVDDEPHALYHVELRMRKSLASFACGDAGLENDEPLELLPEEFTDSDLQGFEDADYYYEDLYPDNYDWGERDNPCSPSYYIPNRFKYRNVLATNLGILAKSGNQRDFTVVVTDLLTADPVSNASVQFYNFQQQQIMATITDPDGMTEIHLDETPFLIEVSYHDQKAFLRVDDGSSLSLSNFDVAGAEVEDGIKGFLYGERGVWRPGDTLHLSLALFDKMNNLPEDIPVTMEVFNARDHLVYKSTSANNLNSIFAFAVPTNQDDPTGNWKAVAKVGGLAFNKNIKVENIRPNRLKMELSFNRDPLVAYDESQMLDFSSTWLHGAPAANMRAEIRLKMVNQKTSFEGYEKYTFTNPLKQYWPDEFTLFDDLLDANGQQKVPVYSTIGPHTPGMLKAVFTSRVYEKGGGFSTDVYSLPYSPYNRYVGVSIPEMDSPNTQLETDSLHQVDVVTLSPTGDPVSVNNLSASVYKIGWSWWWSSQQDNLASYIGGENEKLVYKTRLSTRNGKGSFSFKVDYPEWGRYLVYVYDPESNHGSGQSVYLDWPAWASRDGRANPSGATMLTFTADKEEYEPGNKAVLTFPSVDKARALLTLEAGEEIVYSKWIKTDEGETQVEVEMTDEMAPNVYASLSVIQAHEHEGNDLPIRQYGVLRLNVNNPESKIEPVIEMPEEIRPNSDYSIKISESNGDPMTYTLAVVDEGLLNLTRYKTPDPWSAFYATEALGMKTWDLYDDVIGAFGGRIESLLSIGGDEGEIEAGANKANRFVPVVTYLGPFDLKKDRSQTHDISMPNYVGEVRAMVIAGDGLAWGSAEASAFVRQPLMVISSLPRKLSPNEKVDLPVSVFVMKEGMQSAKVRVTTEGPVKCIGSNEVTISAANLGEQMVYFPLETSDETGVGKIIIEVVSGNEKAEHDTEIQILNPNPYVYTTNTYVIEEGQEVEIPVDFYGSPGTNSGSISISGLPSFNLEENLQYLINYPYGCLEQVSSSAFVQLLLDKMTDLDDNQKLETDANIRTAIRKIANFQLPSGGLALWPGVSGVNLWATTYAGHFLLLAEQKGYVIPGLLKEKWLKFQKARVSSFSSRTDYAGDSDLQQAYRLYTLALANEPDLSAMNRLKEKSGLNQQAAWRLAAAYAISGRSEVAESLITKFNSPNFTNTKHQLASFGSSLRDQAMMLETMLLLDQKTQAFELAQKVIKELASYRWSTQTTAYSMLALAQLSANTDNSGMMKFTVNDGSQDNKVNTQKLSWQLLLDEAKAGTVVSVTNRNEGPLYVEFTAYGQASEGLTEASASGLIMNYQFADLDGNTIDPFEIKQGTTFWAEVLIQNPAVNGFMENLALTQIFPSGWEIISTRYADDGSGNQYTYRDIRDDRVYTFFDLGAGAAVSFSVKINAAYVGEYFLAPISCEAMYRPEIYAHAAGFAVKVIGNR